MALRMLLDISGTPVGMVIVQRRERLDISDPQAIADFISTYVVYVDGEFVGTVRHRYGDGAYRLMAIVGDLIADSDGEKKRLMRLGRPTD